MRIVIFGLSVSSSWGNGHATLWRSLIDGLDRAGHRVVFYERDVPYHAAHRDLRALPGHARLRLYQAWTDICGEAAVAINDADAAIVTSYCPDARAAAALILDSRARCRVFYDLDTPVTLRRLGSGEEVEYLPAAGLGEFDLVLSFTGGRALELLRTRLGARRVAPLHGSVDPEHHRPVAAIGPRVAECSYLGAWSDDRQASLEALFIEPARKRPLHRFILGGSMFPADPTWPPNIARLGHVAPPEHPSFYASAPLTISATRAPMVELGHCPSGRLFEAAACGVPVLSDAWDGIEQFFTPGEEILIARDVEQALAAIDLPRERLARIGRNARDRALSAHTARHRAAELITLLAGAR
jgi:spore maturation protein CgeB